MPYFTKKGTGKDKGKTCVHKKSSKKKVGCTDGPIEKYLTALRMAESDDMGWIKDAGQNKILTINKLKELFKKNNIDVDWDIEYDRSADGHGEYNEYFGKFYYDRENPISYNESYFIELYEKENGHLFFQLYRYNEEDNYYHRDEVYSNIETSSKNPEKFWRTVGWLVLYQMGKINVGHGEETFDVENTIEESNELDWMKGPISFSWGEIKHDIHNYVITGDTIYLSGNLQLDEDDDWERLELNNEPGIVKSVRGEGTSRRLDLLFGENITNLPLWYNNMGNDDLDLGTLDSDDDIAITIPIKNINESNELDWIKNLDTYYKVEQLEVGKTYEFVPDYSIMDNEGFDDIPNWVPSHLGQKLYILRQNPKSRFPKLGEITFKQIGLSNKMVYDGNYHTVAYTARLFLWGKFKEVENPEFVMESNSLEWIENTAPKFTAELLEPGQKFYDKWGDVTRVLEYMGKDEENICYEPPCTLLKFRKIKDPSGYHPYQSVPADDPLNTDMIFIPSEFDRDIDTGKLTPIFGDLNESDESYEDPLKWIKDVKTNQDITQELYDGLEWHKEDDTVFVTPQWNGHRFSVRPSKYGRDKIIINPSSFHVNYRKYMIEALGIWRMDDVKEIYFSLRKLIAQKIHNNLNESDELDWIKDVEAIKSPKVSENNRYVIWLGELEGYEREQIKDWLFKNLSKCNKPPFTDLNFENKAVVTFSSIDCGVGGFKDSSYEVAKESYQAWSKVMTPLDPQKILRGVDINESDELDWVKDVKPKGFEKSKSYVVDVSDLKPYTSMSTSPTSEEYTKLTRADVLNNLRWLGYNIDGIPVDEADYLYIEPNDNAGYWDDSVWVSETHWVDYDMEHNTPDPTYNGKYEVMDVNDLMFLFDNKMISESNDFDWVKEIPLTMNTCEAYYILKPGDEIIIDAIDNWEDNPNQWDDGNDDIYSQTFYSVKAKVLALDECSNIHRNNESNARTILVSIEENGYYGFDDSWSSDFVGTLPSQCQRDNCMFLICEDSEPDYEITLIEPSLNESNDFDWADEVPSDYYLPDLRLGLKFLEKWVGQAYQTDDEIGLSVQDVKENPNKENIQDLINVLKHWKPYHDGDEVYWAVEDLISSINPERFKDVSDRGLGESKKTINEAAGISFEARKWGEIVYNEIMGNPNEKKRLIIDGYDHPEAFDGFPIDYVVIDFYDKLTGYGQEHSGYDKDGNYVVLLYVQPKLLQGQGGYSLKSVLNHEMKHAWDDYNRLSKGLPSIDNTKETKELYNKDFILMLSDQNIRGPIKELLKYYYYLSKLETTAYLENVYDGNPVYERVVREIASKDFGQFKERLDLDVNWHLMNTAYDIPLLKKFKSPIDFIDYSSEELRSRAIKMIKKINKMKYVHGKL